MLKKRWNRGRALRRRPFIMVLFWTSLLVGCSVLIPLILVQHGQSVLADDPLKVVYTGQSEREDDPELPIIVPIYMSELQQIEELPLEGYIRGVIAAEMPAEFELEALKAQAIAARTYIIRRIVDEDFSHVPVA